MNVSVCLFDICLCVCCSAKALITFTERVVEMNVLAPMNYIIVEVLFGFLLQLPSPPQVPVYYSSVFIELSKIDPGSYPRIVSTPTELAAAHSHPTSFPYNNEGGRKGRRSTL